MTLEEHYRLSFYQPVKVLGGREHIALTRHTVNGTYYVRKELKDYNREIYEQLWNLDSDYFPHICEMVEEQGRLILVEEYLTGRTLEEQVLQSGTMTVEQIKPGLLQLCEALHLLHTQQPPVIHRDIKPSNVICTVDGDWKLIDFNTARYYDADANRDTTFLGTREYAAPEQFGDLQTDVRTDIYEMGAMLNYLLTGKNHKKYLYPGVAEDIIRKCTQFNPTRRYQSVDALRREIQKLPERFPEDSESQKQNQRNSNIQNFNSKKLNQKNQKKKERQILNQCHNDNTERRTPPAGWRFWLPPGFRSGKIWKMLLAGVVYAFALWVSLTLEVTSSTGITVTRRMVIANRGGMLGIFLALVCFWFDYGGIQSYLPLTRKPQILWKLLGYLVWSAVIFFGIIILILLLGG